MAFSNTFIEKINIGNGLVMERGTFTGTAVTTGTITADTTTQPEITEILMWGAADDADNAVICARDVDSNKLKLTFTSGDTGDYWFVGRAK